MDRSEISLVSVETVDIILCTAEKGDEKSTTPGKSSEFTLAPVERFAFSLVIAKTTEKLSIVDGSLDSLTKKCLLEGSADEKTSFTRVNDVEIAFATVEGNEIFVSSVKGIEISLSFVEATETSITPMEGVEIALFPVGGDETPIDTVGDVEMLIT